MIFRTLFLGLIFLSSHSNADENKKIFQLYKKVETEIKGLRGHRVSVRIAKVSSKRNHNSPELKLTGFEFLEPPSDFITIPAKRGYRVWSYLKMVDSGLKFWQIGLNSRVKTICEHWTNALKDLGDDKDFVHTQKLKHWWKTHAKDHFCKGKYSEDPSVQMAIANTKRIQGLLRPHQYDGQFFNHNQASYLSDELDSQIAKEIELIRIGLLKPIPDETVLFKGPLDHPYWGARMYGHIINIQGSNLKMTKNLRIASKEDGFVNLVGRTVVHVITTEEKRAQFLASLEKGQDLKDTKYKFLNKYDPKNTVLIYISGPTLGVQKVFFLNHRDIKDDGLIGLHSQSIDIFESFQ